MINDVNLTDIRTFILVAEHGSFTKAALLLAVSRSYVSRQVSQLEKDLGVTLLFRTTRAITLTQTGMHFFNKCKKALTDIDQALVAAIDDTEEMKGLIKINCVGGYIGESIISRYICDFMQLNPKIKVHLDFSSHRIDLIQDEFDLSFRMGDLQDASYVAKKLMDIEILTLASPEYIARYGMPLHPKELNHHQCLTGTVTRWSFKDIHGKEQFDLNLDGQFVCKNGHALLLGARLGNGIIRVPKMYCQKELTEGLLVQVLPKWQVPKSLFSIIYHKDKFQPKRLRNFIRYIQERIKDDDF